MQALRNGKALGGHWLSPEVLRGHKEGGLYSAVATLFNAVLQQGPPPEWNVVAVTSIHKKGDRRDPNNYRGIAVSATLPKLYA